MELGNYKVYKLDICYAIDEYKTVLKGKEKTPLKEWVRKGYYSSAKSALNAVADYVVGDNLNDVNSCLSALKELQQQIKESK